MKVPLPFVDDSAFTTGHLSVMDHDMRRGGIAAASNHSLRAVESETRECIRCSTMHLSCDSLRPGCGRCATENMPTCSYQWTLSAIVALFPPVYNFNNVITLRSIESHTDEGGFSKVYRTSRKDTGSDVAVKVLLRKKKTTERIMLLALREALTWSRLHHERIVPLIGVANYSKICEGAAPQLCLVSPWMHAGNVMEYLVERPGADRYSLMLDISDAVCYLHSESPAVIHGDIRGSNILIDVREGRPRASLTDFGLSFIIEETTGGLHSTSTGRSGHPRWLAPERLFPENFNLSPSTSKSEASDVFEMCRTFLEILSGNCPFIGFNDFTVVRMVGEGKRPERPPLVTQGVADVIWNTLERGWTQDRQFRPSAREIRGIIWLEMMICIEGPDEELGSLIRNALPSSDVMLEPIPDTDISLGLLAILSRIEWRFRTTLSVCFHEEAVVNAMALISYIMLHKDSASYLRAILDLLMDVERIVDHRAPMGWRTRHIHLFVDRERGLLKADLRVLGFLLKLDYELYTSVRSHISSLLCSHDIGEICRTWIIRSGALSAVFADFEAYSDSTRPGSTYVGLTLINVMTSGHALEEAGDSFLEAGLLYSLSRCFQQGKTLYWEVIIAWNDLLNRFLQLIKDDGPWRPVLLTEQRLGWQSLVVPGRDVTKQGITYATVLHAASCCGHETLVRALLENGADVEVEDEAQLGSTALHFASQAGHEKVVRLLLTFGANVKAEDGTSRTALHIASGAGQETVVQMLLDRGADVKAADRSRPTALHRASEAGYDGIVLLLLDSGADVDARDWSASTALHFASKAGHEKVVWLLLDRGADVKAADRIGLTALRLASKAGHERVARLLLDNGADVNAQRNGRHTTALHLASEAGYDRVVRLLLDRGADVNTEDGFASTALLYASMSGHEKVVQLLLDRGADLKAADRIGSTALHLASKAGHEKVVWLLLDSGADVKAEDERGWTALHHASQAGHEKVVRLLLDFGADVKAEDRSRSTALHRASKAGYDGIVLLLLDSGADVDARDWSASTALYFVSKAGHEKVVRLLLDRGADVNAGDGYTALHAASMGGHRTIVRLLIERGADVNARPGVYWTPLCIARQYGREAVVQILLQNGAR